MDTEARIAAALAAPKTHAVVATYACGKVRRTETRSLASAITHADFVELPKVGRDLIDRESGETVRVVSVAIEAIA